MNNNNTYYRKKKKIARTSKNRLILKALQNKRNKIIKTIKKHCSNKLEINRENYQIKKNI